MKFEFAGQVIQQRREAAGHSIRGLCASMDWAPNRLSRYERGDRPIPGDDVIAIAKQLKLPPEELLMECIHADVRGIKGVNPKSKISKLLDGIVADL